MNKKDTEEKALFVQRFVAYLIDMLLISTVATFISVPFVDHDRVNKLNEQTLEIIENYSKQEITMDDYYSQYVSIYSKISKVTGITTILSIFLSVSYFVVYQVYAKGQTIGKKLMKIKVESEEGDLSYNQMIFRSFIADSILVDLICFVFMMILNDYNYFYLSSIFRLMQFIVTLVSIVMIIVNKKGYAVHDKITHTRVVRVK